MNFVDTAFLESTVRISVFGRLTWVAK